MEDLNEEDEQTSDGDEEALEPVVRTTKGKSRAGASGSATEIPYTFPCPATIEEFEDILDGLADSALATVVQRVRSLHHPSLAQGNKEKLQVGLRRTKSLSADGGLGLPRRPSRLHTYPRQPVCPRLRPHFRYHPSPHRTRQTQPPLSCSAFHRQASYHAKESPPRPGEGCAEAGFEDTAGSS